MIAYIEHLPKSGNFQKCFYEMCCIDVDNISDVFISLPLIAISFRWWYGLAALTKRAIETVEFFPKSTLCFVSFIFMFCFFHLYVLFLSTLCFVSFNFMFCFFQLFVLFLRRCQFKTHLSLSTVPNQHFYFEERSSILKIW